MTAVLLAASVDEPNFLVPHPLELALLSLVLLPPLVTLVVATVKVSRGRIPVWPTFSVAVLLTLMVPCVGWIIALVILLSRRVVPIDAP